LQELRKDQETSGRVVGIQARSRTQNFSVTAETLLLIQLAE